MFRISKSALQEVFSHAEQTSPDECCGCLSAEASGEVVTQAHRCENIQNRLHEEDPAAHPRTARDAFMIDPLALAQNEEALDDRGRRLAGIYHSHPEGDPLFSQEDKRRSMIDDEPMWPGAHYLIVSVRGGKAGEPRSFVWDPEVRDFVEEPVQVEVDASPP